MRYFMTPDALIYISLGGPDIFLLDHVCGVGYQDQANKVPVYSHKDVRFSAAAEGRAIVSGMLLLNKGYKDMKKMKKRFIMRQYFIKI